MTDLPKQNEEHYLGDGLYVSFDGWYIKLRAPRENGDHFIGFERETYQEFLRWLAKYRALWEQFATPSRGLRR